jgi:tRNA(fMet)-specific endonuclease VapC
MNLTRTNWISPFLIFMLDTNVLIYASQARPETIRRIAELDGVAVTSALCLAEFERGVVMQAKLAGREFELLARLQILAFDTAAMMEYKNIIATIGFNRVRDFDRMIAAHAISMQATLLTANHDDFRDIPKLKLHSVQAN